MIIHPRRVFSGIQPTGTLHIGNYFGALKQFLTLQEDSSFEKRLFCVVDLHAQTVAQDPAQLKNNVLQTMATFLACGLNPHKSILFVQSHNPDHTSLCWHLACVARVGWLERMTQFKDKTRLGGIHGENASVGLYIYPILMAADILAYRATHVPVGEDQKQHLELVAMIARKMEGFPIPKPIETTMAARVMSLRDGRKKMSKSDPSSASRIDLTDGKDAIVRKIRKAKTDSDPLPDNVLGLENRPEAKNLLELMAVLSDKKLEDVVMRFAGKNFLDLKEALTEHLIERVVPIGEGIARYMSDRAELERIIQEGGEKARNLSAPVRERIKG